MLNEPAQKLTNQNLTKQNLTHHMLTKQTNHRTGVMLAAARWLTCCGIVSIAIAIVGCSDRPANRPATYPVSGIVQFSGSPVAGATVGFQSKQPQGRSASAITDAQGRYKLTTFSVGDGAPPGNYGVIVLKYKETASASGGEYRPVQGPEPPPQHELPPKYAAAATSGLEATVGVTALEFNIDLSGK
jgi:hypothetical protein